MKKTVLLFSLLMSIQTLGFSSAGKAAKPSIDNERVTVWDTKTALPPADDDFVVISLTKKGTAALGHKGEIPNRHSEHSVVILLKNYNALPVVNNTGYPLAFPRPHVVKLAETDKVIVWSYRWNLNEPTPVHFHDKDVVVVYEEDTALKSMPVNGPPVLNEYKANSVYFNRANRTHSEVLIRDTGSAVITELK